MPVQSIRKQLAFIALLFLVFAGLVFFQFFRSHAMQEELNSELRASHKIIGDYLALEEAESQIVERIRVIAEGIRQNPSDVELSETASQITEWFQKLQLWREALAAWAAPLDVKTDEAAFSSDFKDLKKRQADAYSKAITLCKEGKYKDASYVLTIEKSYRPSIHKTILAILDGIKIQIEADNASVRHFYVGTAFSLLVAMLALVASSVGIFLSLSRNFKTLEAGALRVAKGDFSQMITDVKSPEELASLAKTFNDMQTAVKTRDEKIREDNEEIKKLNESLEHKVLERNKTIMQQNIALKRKNEELEQVLYAASHDLRTPLIGIQGFSEELKMACADLAKKLKSQQKPSPAEIDSLIKEDIELALNHIINGSKRMEILLEGLLRISRMGRESLQMQQIDMNELVKNVAAGFDYQIKELGAKLSLGELAPCVADPSQFEQVFTNLIGNAIKYREPSRPLEIEVGSEQDQDFIRYYVQDNGIGIPEEHIERVFHAFFRVDPEKVEGDGVGLAIVNRALDLHGGRAWVESSVGLGSRFVVEIPKNNFGAPKNDK